MNTAALPEMLHYLNKMGSLTRNDTDMSVLERQQVRIKWQQHQQQGEHSYFSGVDQFSVFPIPSQAPQFQGLVNNDSGVNELVARAVKEDPGLENGCFGFGKFGVEGSGFGSCVMANGSGLEMNYGLARTASCPPVVADILERETILPENPTSAAGRESFKKRKADKSPNLKGIQEDDTKEKRLKGCAEEEESKITEQNSNDNKKTSNCNNNNRENSGDTSKDNSKVSEVRKPDYIHVRARRGQATDSHSLAERVRREKISERMKYLQDLVPGCNKITGKAGMLDEIINYVQSLQRQVEFLSMKLAAVNPSLDFNIDHFFTKEVFPACTSNFPTIGLSPDMANPPYIQFNPLQQVVSCCELEMGTNPLDTTLRRTISDTIPIPETFIDTSCFNQIQATATWDADLQNLYAMEFQQGRSTSFRTQEFTGSIEASSLKMEM